MLSLLLSSCNPFLLVLEKRSRHGAPASHQGKFERRGGNLVCEMCRAGKEREAALMHSLLSSASDLREDLFVPKHLGLGLWDFLPSESHTQSSHITPRCLTLQQHLLTAALGAPSWRIFSSPSTSQQLPGCWGSSKETTLILCAVSHRWEFSSSPACGAAAAQNSPLPADSSPTTSSSHSSSPSLSCTYRDGKRRITQHKIPALPPTEFI